MKLTVLVDNNTEINKYLSAEPALSFFIEHNNKEILFDCGYSDIFIQNAFKLKIDLRKITDIVFSHGHNDHTGGLFYLKKLYQDSKELGINVNFPKITAHPEIFNPKIEEKIGNVGCPISEKHLQGLFELNLTNIPLWITPDLVFLGEIPQENEHFCSCIDDSALVYKSTKGLVIITGCSHSGLKNIIEYAKKVTMEDKLYDIIGGFHLIDKKESEIISLIDYLKTQNINFLSPCHCCNLKSKILLSQELQVREVNVGMVFEY